MLQRTLGVIKKKIKNEILYCTRQVYIPMVISSRALYNFTICKTRVYVLHTYIVGIGNALYLLSFFFFIS